MAKATNNEQATAPIRGRSQRPTRSETPERPSNDDTNANPTATHPFANPGEHTLPNGIKANTH